MTSKGGSVLNRVIRGRVWVFGDSLDTDGIHPYYLYPDPAETYKHTLESFRPEFPKGVREGDLVVTGKNFGCGSGRPATSVFKIGVAAVVSESLAPLMLRNSVGNAHPVIIAPGVTSLVEDHQTLEIDYPNGVVRNVDTGRELPIRKYPRIVERIYEAGGILQFARQRYLAEVGR
ncbi:MAG: 3-isopropylmalate dehydratase [Dehalococcoidia bacterium]